VKATKIFLYIWILPTILFAQENKLAIGITVSPSFYTVTSETGFNHHYASEPGFRGGVDLSFHLSRKSILTTGVYYSSVGYKVEYNYILNDPGDPAIPRSGDINAGYVDIPIAYNFNFISKEKLILYISSGIISSMLISSDDKTTFEDNSIRSSGYLNSFLLSLQLGIGFRYNISDRLGIKIEPQYQFFMEGIDKMMNQHPASFNIALGIVYGLKSK